LPLLVFRIFTNNRYSAAATNDLALNAHFFNSSSYFHNLLLVPIGYSTLVQIVRCHLDRNPITG